MDSKRLQGFFHWKYSGVLIPFLWGGMLAVLGIAASIEKSGPLFIFAYIFSFAGFIWSLGLWLTCDFLYRKNPEFWPRSKKKRSTKKDWTIYQVWKISVSISIMAVFFMSYFFIEWIDQQKELSSLQGWLKPANDPIPPHHCGSISRDDKIIFLGAIISITNKFPHTILKVKGEKRIVIDKNTDGTIAVSLDVLDKDGKVIASIEKGNFVVNRNNFLKIERRDRSSLRVIDQSKNEVLNIRYFNPQALWIDAILHYPGVAPIVINGSNFGSFQGAMCLSSFTEDIVID